MVAGKTQNRVIEAVLSQALKLDEAGVPGGFHHSELKVDSAPERPGSKLLVNTCVANGDTKSRSRGVVGPLRPGKEVDGNGRPAKGVNDERR